LWRSKARKVKRCQSRLVDDSYFSKRRASKIRILKKRPRKNKQPIKTEYIKASIRAKVEHPFRIIKCQFGFRKAIYRGLAKNDSKLAMLFALANVFRVDQMTRAERG
jgi:IS5 family transposase